jgi:hypothetical protein
VGAAFNPSTDADHRLPIGIGLTGTVRYSINGYRCDQHPLDRFWSFLLPSAELDKI